MPFVAVENVHKTFGVHRVLNGVSLSVSRGEALAVLGRSGTGKSVLLRLIIGLEKPDTGSVCIHGQDIVGLALDRMGEIRKKRFMCSRVSRNASSVSRFSMSPMCWLM